MAEYLVSCCDVVILHLESPDLADLAMLYAYPLFKHFRLARNVRRAGGVDSFRGDTGRLLEFYRHLTHIDDDEWQVYATAAYALRQSVRDGPSWRRLQVVWEPTRDIDNPMAVGRCPAAVGSLPRGFSRACGSSPRRDGEGTAEWSPKISPILS